MNRQKIMDSLNDIDERFILEASPAVRTNKTIKAKQVKRIAWAALAASVLLFAGVLFALSHGIGSKDPAQSASNDESGSVISEASSTVSGSEVSDPGQASEASPSGQASSGETGPSGAESGSSEVSSAQPGNSDSEPTETPEATPAIDPDLPMITVPAFINQGMFFEGRMAYEAEELTTAGSPWEMTDISVLPVFRSGRTGADGWSSYALEEEEMRARLAEAADALGLSVTSAETSASGGITAATEDGTITVTPDGTVSYLQPAGHPLPEEYHFTSRDTTPEEAEAVMAYLLETYADFLGFEEPRTMLQYDYTYGGECVRRYYAYDAADSATGEAAGAAGDPTAAGLLNSCLRYAHFSPDDFGNLLSIRLCDGLACAEKIGDYPLITAEEARAAVLAGNGLTSAPFDFPGADYIAKTELVYRGASQYEDAEALLPYYRFYVELPDTSGLPMQIADGLKVYGAWYVPAVQPQYLAS
ncbi:MAG: hypothetical protein IJL72_02335 [Lachnospiraceae bacterium]|nr:hypothetical protein [Lachnospiraceae bacterium]